MRAGEQSQAAGAAAGSETAVTETAAGQEGGSADSAFSSGTESSASGSSQASAPAAGSSGSAGGTGGSGAAVSVPKPTISGTNGLSPASVQVSLACALPEAKIRYTLDGSTPSASSGREYSGPVAVDATVRLNAIAYVVGGASSPVASLQLTVGELHVALGAKGDGRIESALGSIAAAVKKAASSGYKRIKVSAGSYSESMTVSSTLELSGGWNASYTKKTGMTTLSAPSGLDSSQSSPSAAAVFAGAGVGSGAKVSSFVFVGSDSGYAAGALVKDGAQPSFSSCTFRGGSGSYSYGLRAMSGAKARCSYCAFEGGSGGTSYGLSADSSKVDVSASTAQAGSGSVASYAMAYTNAQGVIASCALYGGKGGTTYGIAFYQCPSTALYGNTILGGAGKTSYSVFCAYTAPAVLGNIIGQASFGFYENYGDSSPSRLESNCFFDCSQALYSDSEAKNRVNYTGVDASGNLLAGGAPLATPWGKGNVLATPVLGAAPSFKTQASSPEALRSGGIALPGIDFDLAGNKRSAPFAIGAWEI